MKNLIPITILASLTATGIAQAQEPAYSKPSGYVTETLKGDGTFNLVGLTLHESVIASGTISGVSATKITDSQTNFGSVLTAGVTYILQFKTGAQLGGVQIVTEWGAASGNENTDNDLVVPDDVLGMGVAVGDTYELRQAATLSTVFGEANEAGLKEGDITTADVVWLPIIGGGFSKFYYSPGATFPVNVSAGWKNSSGDDATNQPIPYTDGMFIQRRGAGDLPLVLTGQVKTSSTQVFAAKSQFNFVSGIFPVGTTLGTSGLESALKSGDITTADVLWMQNSTRTGYDKFYYSPGATFPVNVAEGWKNSTGGDATSQALTSGIIIQRRGTTDTAAPIAPPESYSNL